MNNITQKRKSFLTPMRINQSIFCEKNSVQGMTRHIILKDTFKLDNYILIILAIILCFQLATLFLYKYLT